MQSFWKGKDAAMNCREHHTDWWSFSQQTPFSLSITFILSSKVLVFFSASFHMPAKTPGDICNDPTMENVHYAQCVHMCVTYEHKPAFFIGNLDENTSYFMSFRGVIEDFA